ncbi:hypothetical protein BT96DRAFT_965450 [Gymnopus androsaceus JB14]|uniref:Methyltransferase domain-containing protein n=1 Tax=Gymnopus androsaceus JB14 TaxID=1447944 RepID=A0A6A4HQZ0_9AGAR|nr:hypothetical protein BT96DRAFT_965450 [Gymnopus androsaceus JB14]
MTSFATSLNTPAPTAYYLALDEKYYDLDEEEITFFKKQTGIEDDAKLKKHIIAIQTKAFAIHPYPCIRVFEFARLTLGRLPAYEQLLKLGKERKDAILIDVGCCFGNGIRQAVQDGYPVQNTLSSDLRGGLWDLGHELFKSTPQSFPTSFVEGNVLDSAFLSSDQFPFTKDSSPPVTAVPSLGTVTSLNDLHGHVSAIYTGHFFHLFSETQQEQIAHGLAGLLSPEPGWKELCEGIFGVGCVQVKAELGPPAGGLSFFDMYPENKTLSHRMAWSVTRL